MARLTAHSLRRSSVLTSVLLGVVSLLIAFFAFQASLASNTSQDLQAVVGRLTVQQTEQSQADYADHVSDTVIWAQIFSTGGTVEDNPLWPLLTQRWQDAVSRSETSNSGVATAYPVDSRYTTELTIKSRAFDKLILDTNRDAQAASGVSSRLTGASVIFSAALLLLTVASTTPREGGRLALNAAALAIMVIAVLIGFVR